MKNVIGTGINDFILRIAKEKDVPLVLQFIKELANYERLLSEVDATEEVLYESLFVHHAAEAIIGEYKGKPVGFALFYYNFSTFIGKPGIFLEDLYVKPEMRGKGIGRVMLSYLGKLAKERNFSRVEWNVLKWNESAIRFYEYIGAKPMNEWTTYRVSGESLDLLAKDFEK